ncbi:WG repeat-containing protein [Halomonas daqiaonensis]|uniref:WG containing repeat-containing protein n=1 Tax=Halomonas daqiaonensis TaxID=650850 RepID=A0A1H7QPY6_9GAMM|nr:WG repeat-containing protein [Halomonas daqiaonensis]SEL49982.1 WG containing repeat-containing protein [Halomonas daqiaonensis]
MSRNVVFLTTAMTLAGFAGLSSGKADAQTQETCADGECFVEAVRSCTSATYGIRDGIGLGAAARYRVLGQEGSACRIGFSFTENPNPALVDQSLTFLVDPDAASKDMLLGAVKSCLTGSTEDYGCSGALVAQVGNDTASSGTLVAGDGPFPCGREPTEADEASLYPMPKDGKWGYVDRSGDWHIAPQWDQAHAFHEGRAAVGGMQDWGIIDRAGNYVVEPRYESGSLFEFNGRRWGTSPFVAYSEGCTVAAIFTNEPQRSFFVDRDGKTYWREELPESLQTRDIRDFGTFSEGLAWFQVGQSFDARRYGWIDATGNVAIESDFTEAGPFSGGLAPASVADGQAGFISPDGQLQLPRKWTLDNTTAFSEGLAKVWTGPFDIAFMDRNDFVFDSVTFGAEPGKKAANAAIDTAGRFQDGLAPIVTDFSAGRDLVYVKPDGQVAFVPNEIDGIAVCDPRQLSEYHNGLVRLVVAKDGKSCGEERYLSGLAEYDHAVYVYLDTEGRIALRQEQQ